MVIFKIRNFKLSDINQGIINMPYKKIGVFSHFEKSYPEKRKKSKFCVSRATLFRKIK